MVLDAGRAALKGENIVLQAPIDISYAEAIAELANHPSIRETIGAHGFPYPYTIEDATFFIERNRSELSLPFAIDFIIIYKDEPSGVIGLGDINYLDRKAHIGYWIGADYRRKGIATEAAGLVCKYAFEEMKLHRLETKVLSTNRPSARVLEKNGFRLEGTERDAFFMDNRFLSFDIYGRINEKS